MDKLIEKALTFIILISFLSVSFALLNLNAIEYKIKSKDVKENDSVVVFENNISQWLLDNTLCEEFGILRRSSYAITKCIGKDGEISYLKDDVPMIYDLKKDYFYEYEHGQKNFKAYVLEAKPKEIEKDFYNLLGVELSSSHKKEDDIKENNSKATFNLIKKPKKNSDFVFIKKEKQPKFLMLQKTDNEK